MLHIFVHAPYLEAVLIISDHLIELHVREFCALSINNAVRYIYSSLSLHNAFLSPVTTCALKPMHDFQVLECKRFDSLK